VLECLGDFKKSRRHSLARNSVPNQMTNHPRGFAKSAPSNLRPASSGAAATTLCLRVPSTNTAVPADASTAPARNVATRAEVCAASLVRVNFHFCAHFPCKFACALHLVLVADGTVRKSLQLQCACYRSAHTCSKSGRAKRVDCHAHCDKPGESKQMDGMCGKYGEGRWRRGEALLG